MQSLCVGTLQSATIVKIMILLNKIKIFQNLHWLTTIGKDLHCRIHAMDETCNCLTSSNYDVQLECCEPVVLHRFVAHCLQPLPPPRLMWQQVRRFTTLLWLMSQCHPLSQHRWACVDTAMHKQVHYRQPLENYLWGFLGDNSTIWMKDCR